MKKIVLLFLLFFILHVAQASDSIALARIIQLNRLYSWLEKRPVQDPDSKLYDTVITLFFNKKQLDYLLENHGSQDDIYPKEMKIKLLQEALSTYHALAKKVRFKNIHFYTHQQQDTDSEEDLTKSNSVTIFLLGNGERYDMLSANFANNSTQLVSIVLCGMEAQKATKFQQYYDKLKKE